MKEKIDKILAKNSLKKDDIITLLSTYDNDDRFKVFARANQVKEKYVGKKVALRGLIEYSNICRKSCHYCGIRACNSKVVRYTMESDDLLNASMLALEKGFGSVVIQSGEIQNSLFVDKISQLLNMIKSKSDNQLGITLSCGEQKREVYRRWFHQGAHRYLLRIETANRELFNKIHPNDRTHRYDERIRCLLDLKSIGYQVGTGIMIGLPGQTLEDLAGDLLFFKQMDVDMVGMGPYLEHMDTPMYAQKDDLLPLNHRFNLSLLMIAVLRLIMKDINIAASTALQALEPCGREKGIFAGANVIMPNVTPLKYRDDYILYNNKPGVTETADRYIKRLEKNLKHINEEVLYNSWGDSKHYKPVASNNRLWYRGLLMQSTN